MSLAEQTRKAVQDHPFVHEALRVGVLNYTAAARLLTIDGDTDAIATALRRYENDLSDPSTAGYPVVRMRRNVGVVSDHDEHPAEPLLAIQSTKVIDEGSATAVLISGELSTRQQGALLTGLAVADIKPLAVGFDQASGIVVVDGSKGTTTLRRIEAIVGGPTS